MMIWQIYSVRESSSCVTVSKDSELTSAFVCGFVESEPLCDAKIKYTKSIYQLARGRDLTFNNSY